MKSQYLPTHISIGEQQFPVVYRHSAKAKRLSMKVATDRSLLTITLPTRCCFRDFEEFLVQCTTWLTQKLKQWGPIEKTFTAFNHGSQLPILGKDRRIHIDDLNLEDQITLKEDTLVVPKSIAHPRLIRSYLSKLLYDYVRDKSRVYAEGISESINMICVKNLRSSYGLCSSKCTITYALRLIYAPIEVIDYVCAHEVSHLKHMNHSPAFWKTVKHILPEYETHKKWIKNNGHTLMQYIAL